MECADVFSTRDFFKFTANSSFLFYFYVFLLKYLPSCRPQDRREAPVATLWRAKCRDKGVGEDNCVLKKDCPICKSFTPEQVQQLATPTYRERKSKAKKMILSSPAPTLVDPSHVSVLGKVEGQKTLVQPETTPAGKKKKHSFSPKPSPRSSKKKPSTSSLDDKWPERFARLESMLLAKSFTIPVEPVVKPAAEVTTSQKPFFDPVASTSSFATSTGNSGPSHIQATGDAVDEMQTAT